MLLQLGGEPTRETRERVRRDREVQVRQPMIDLLSDLADVDSWYEDFALFRAAVAADESGRALEDLVVSLAADGHEIGSDVMSRVPRGYPAGQATTANR